MRQFNLLKLLLLLAAMTALGGAVLLGLTWNMEARGEGESALALTEGFVREAGRHPMFRVMGETKEMARNS
jgi:hypothetical protein